MKVKNEVGPVDVNWEEELARWPTAARACRVIRHMPGATRQVLQTFIFWANLVFSLYA
jgi:hypothetical protein